MHTLSMQYKGNMHYYKKWKRRPENNDGLSENRRGF